MTLLKSLIQRLLDSRTTPKQAAHSAMPGGSTITLLSNASVSDWGTISTGTATDDGYLVLTAKNGGNEGASLSLNVNDAARQSLTYPFVGAGGNVFVPIAKGDTWSLLGSSSIEITLKLFKVIGGGYSIIETFKEVSICLRSSFNCLQKNFLRTKKSGFLNKVLLTRTGISVFHAPQQRNLFVMSCQRTVICLLDALIQQFQLLKFSLKICNTYSLLSLMTILTERVFADILLKARCAESCVEAVIRQTIQLFFIPHGIIISNKEGGWA